MKHVLRHERLDAYHLAVECARWYRTTAFPRGNADLKDQGKRASQSVVLNLAEGVYREGRDRLHHFRIAQGSAGEACAVLDLVSLPGGPEIQQKLRRVVAMLHKLR